MTPSCWQPPRRRYRRRRGAGDEARAASDPPPPPPLRAWHYHPTWGAAMAASAAGHATPGRTAQRSTHPRRGAPAVGGCRPQPPAGEHQGASPPKKSRHRRCCRFRHSCSRRRRRSYRRWHSRPPRPGGRTRRCGAAPASTARPDATAAVSRHRAREHRQGAGDAPLDFDPQLLTRPRRGGHPRARMAARPAGGGGGAHVPHRAGGQGGHGGCPMRRPRSARAPSPPPPESDNLPKAKQSGRSRRWPAAAPKMGGGGSVAPASPSRASQPHASAPAARPQCQRPCGCVGGRSPLAPPAGTVRREPRRCAGLAGNDDGRGATDGARRCRRLQRAAASPPSKAATEKKKKKQGQPAPTHSTACARPVNSRSPPPPTVGRPARAATWPPPPRRSHGPP